GPPRLRERPREARRRQSRRHPGDRVRALRARRRLPSRRARMAARRRQREPRTSPLRPTAVGGEHRDLSAAARGRRARRAREEARAMAAEVTVGLIARGDPQEALRSAPSVLHQSWDGAKVLKVVDAEGAGDLARRLARLGTGSEALEVLPAGPCGTAEARNLILRQAETRYLAWIDAGDVWHPRKLELQLKALEAARGTPVIVTCRWYSRGTDAASSVTATRGDDAGPELALAPFSALVGESEVFKAAGELDERLALLADDEYLLRLALAGAVAASAQEGLALCGLAPRTRDDPSQFADEAQLVLARHEGSLAGRFGRRAAKTYRRQLTASPGSERDRGPGTWHAVRARPSALAKRIGTRLLAANALDPTHPAVVAFVRFLTGSGRSSLASVAPGLIAMAAEGEADGAARGDGRPPLSAVERSVLTVVHACCAVGKL